MTTTHYHMAEIDFREAGHPLRFWPQLSKGAQHVVDRLGLDNEVSLETRVSQTDKVNALRVIGEHTGDVYDAERWILAAWDTAIAHYKEWNREHHPRGLVDRNDPDAVGRQNAAQELFVMEFMAGIAGPAHGDGGAAGKAYGAQFPEPVADDRSREEWVGDDDDLLGIEPADAGPRVDSGDADDLLGLEDNREDDYDLIG